jgi:hypothetical protein
MPDVGIDWAEVNWFYVAVLAVFVFLSTVIGNLLSFHHRGTAAILSAFFFAVIFLFWSYYPHNLPLPTALAPAAPPPGTAEPVTPATPQAPARPRNPITDITPPATQQ